MDQVLILLTGIIQLVNDLNFPGENEHENS